MNIENLKNHISDIVKINYCKMHLLLKSDNGYEIKIANLENVETQEEVAKLFNKGLQDTIINNEDITVSNLSTSDDEENKLYLYDFNEYPEEIGIIKNFNIFDEDSEIKLSKENNYEVFNFKNDDISNLYGYIIFIGNMEKNIVIFKKFYHIALIKRDTFLLGTVKRESKFKKLDEDDILRLNSSIDIIKIGEEIYILNTKILNKNFSFHKLLEVDADKLVSYIKDINILEDIETFSELKEDIKFLRKFVKIYKSSMVIKKAIPRDKIVEFIKSKLELKSKFKFSDNGTQIRLDTKKSKNNFISLLSDAYVLSELTNTNYNARNKDYL